MQTKHHAFKLRSTAAIGVIAVTVPLFVRISPRSAVRADQVSALMRPISRVRARVRQLDSEVANLLLNMPTVDPNSLTAANVQETYRLVIRNLYRNALRTANPQTSALLVLKADQLAAGLPAFDHLIIRTLPQSANAPGETPALKVIQGLREFLRAGNRVNVRLNSPADMEKYLAQRLGPLRALISAESDSVGAGAISVWPVRKSPATVVEPPAGAPGLPAIGQELTWVQSANLTPGMRRILRKVLLSLQSQMADPHQQKAAMRYYPVIVRCALLAAHLQAGTALSLPAQRRFNHRLELGLILFRDPRTRSSAVRRLMFINLIVSSLEALRQADLPAADYPGIKHCVHRAIAHLQEDSQAARYSSQLATISRLLSAYRSFRAAIAAPPTPMFQADRAKVQQAGSDDFQRVAATLATQYSAHDIAEGIFRLDQARQNIIRLLAMPPARQQALLYRPASALGVKRNFVNWGRSIAKHPDSTGTGAQAFDHFQAVLNLLASIHLSMQGMPRADVVRKISDGRFNQAVKVFLTLQQKLINSLGSRNIAPDDVVKQLAQMHRLFMATRRLAILLDAHNPARRLNLWGGWYLPRPALRLLLRQCEESLVAEYRSITRPTTTSMAHESEEWADFHDAAGAIATVYYMTRHLNPQLNAPAGTWCTTYLCAITPPPPGAIMASHLGQIAAARRLIVSALFNRTHGKLQAAPRLFVKGLRELALYRPAAAQSR